MDHFDTADRGAATIRSVAAAISARPDVTHTADDLVAHTPADIIYNAGDVALVTWYLTELAHCSNLDDVTELRTQLRTRTGEWSSVIQNYDTSTLLAVICTQLEPDAYQAMRDTLATFSLRHRFAARIINSWSDFDSNPTSNAVEFLTWLAAADTHTHHTVRMWAATNCPATDTAPLTPGDIADYRVEAVIGRLEDLAARVPAATTAFISACCDPEPPACTLADLIDAADTLNINT